MAADDPNDPLTIALSAREIEIIELVADGLTNQEIADKLTISKRTVDNPREQCVHQDRLQEQGRPAQLGHGQRQDLP